MKAWESMTNAERAEQTFRDIKLRQERRKTGAREANDFMFNNISLRYLDKFSLYLMSLKQAGVKIELDRTFEDEEVRPEKEPEVYFG